MKDKMQKFYSMPDLAEGSIICMGCGTVIVVMRIKGKNVMPKYHGPQMFCRNCCGEKLTLKEAVTSVIEKNV